MLYGFSDAKNPHRYRDLCFSHLCDSLGFFLPILSTGDTFCSSPGHPLRLSLGVVTSFQDSSLAPSPPPLPASLVCILVPAFSLGPDCLWKCQHLPQTRFRAVTGAHFLCEINAQHRTGLKEVFHEGYLDGWMCGWMCGWMDGWMACLLSEWV